jgi:hypothetical protein
MYLIVLYQKMKGRSSSSSSVSGSRAAVVGPLLALLALPAATIPADPHAALSAMFLVCALLLGSAVLGAGECVLGKRCVFGCFAAVSERCLCPLYFVFDSFLFTYTFTFTFT